MSEQLPSKRRVASSPAVAPRSNLRDSSTKGFTALLAGFSLAEMAPLTQLASAFGIPWDPGRNGGDDQGIIPAAKAGDWSQARHWIDEANARHDTWMWSLSSLIDDLPRAASLCRQPRIVLVFRNPMAAGSHEAGDPALCRTTIKDAAAFSHRMARSAFLTQAPVLLVSYEAAMANLPGLVEAVADFFDIDDPKLRLHALERLEAHASSLAPSGVPPATTFHAYANPPEPDYTLLLSGHARGGTSLLSSIVHDFGVFTGKDHGTFENHKLGKAADEGDWDTVRSLVGDYDASHSRWAWKRPALVNYLDHVLTLTRHPRLILIFKDVLAVAQRRAALQHRDLLEILEKTAGRYASIAGLAADLEVPLLLVNYEAAMRQKADLIDAMAGFCGIDDPAIRSRALANIESNRKDYLEIQAGLEDFRRQKRENATAPAPSPARGLWSRVSTFFRS